MSIQEENTILKPYSTLAYQRAHEHEPGFKCLAVIAARKKPALLYPELDLDVDIGSETEPLPKKTSKKRSRSPSCLEYDHSEQGSRILSMEEFDELKIKYIKKLNSITLEEHKQSICTPTEINFEAFSEYLKYRTFLLKFKESITSCIEPKWIEYLSMSINEKINYFEFIFQYERSDKNSIEYYFENCTSEFLLKLNLDLAMQIHKKYIAYSTFYYWGENRCIDSVTFKKHQLLFGGEYQRKNIEKEYFGECVDYIFNEFIKSSTIESINFTCDSFMTKLNTYLNEFTNKYGQCFTNSTKIIANYETLNEMFGYLKPMEIPNQTLVLSVKHNRLYRKIKDVVKELNIFE